MDQSERRTRAAVWLNLATKLAIDWLEASMEGQVGVQYGLQGERLGRGPSIVRLHVAELPDG